MLRTDKSPLSFLTAKQEIATMRSPFSELRENVKMTFSGFLSILHRLLIDFRICTHILYGCVSRSGANPRNLPPSMQIAAVHLCKATGPERMVFADDDISVGFPVPIGLNLPTANCTPARMIFFKSIRSLPLSFIRTAHSVNSLCSLEKQYEQITESGAMPLKSGAMACSVIANGCRNAWINEVQQTQRAVCYSIITVWREALCPSGAIRTK